MRKFLYECVAAPSAPGQLGFVEVGYMAPDQRKERWKMVGKQLRQPMCKHVIRLYALFEGQEYDPNGNRVWADYLGVDKPLGRQYTEELHYKVSRPTDDYEHPGRRARVMREKISYPKFRLVTGEDRLQVPHNKIVEGYDWTPELFEDRTGDVVLSKDMEALAAAGRKTLTTKTEEPEPEPEEAPKRGRPKKDAV